jgi:hypothetical protein
VPLRTTPQGSATEAADGVEKAGGCVVGLHKEPLGGHQTLLSILPIDRIEPTPFQRDLSDAHHKRLADVISKTGRFLDPSSLSWRRAAASGPPTAGIASRPCAALELKSITALVVAEREVAWQILALNTEKAHNLKERSLEKAIFPKLEDSPAPTPKPEELSSNAARWERVPVLPHRLEGTIAFDCNGEVSRDFRLHSENLTAGGQTYAWVRSRSSSNCQLDSGTLWNPKSTGQQNATEADVLRPSVHLFVGQLDRDRQVQVVAYASALGLVGKVH